MVLRALGTVDNDYNVDLVVIVVHYLRSFYDDLDTWYDLQYDING